MATLTVPLYGPPGRATGAWFVLPVETVAVVVAEFVSPPLSVTVSVTVYVPTPV